MKIVISDNIKDDSTADAIVSNGELKKILALLESWGISLDSKFTSFTADKPLNNQGNSAEPNGWPCHFTMYDKTCHHAGCYERNKQGIRPKRYKDQKEKPLELLEDEFFAEGGPLVSEID